MNAVARGKLAETLLKDILQFNSVKVFTDLSKADIIQKLKQFEKLANICQLFERKLIKRSQTIFSTLDENNDGTLTRE